MQFCSADGGKGVEREREESRYRKDADEDFIRVSDDAGFP